MRVPHRQLQLLLLLAAAAASSQVAAEAEEPAPEGAPVASPLPVFSPSALSGVVPFLEQFTDDWEERWAFSQAKKIVDGVEDDELLRFRGVWSVVAPEAVTIVGDKGLQVGTAAAHHAISAKFPKVIDPAGKPLVVQYEVKLQNGLECGGAYLKLLTATDSFVPEKFDDKAPYTIMFGPDKCGMTNKVHFIFRHKNPKTGAIEEKHLSSHPAAKTDKLTNLYTLIVKPDQSFEILINNESVKSGSLLEDFEPPVNPPKEIDDPDDHQPQDWVLDEKIPDPDATKPDDWDETAPLEIVDVDAKKPEDWLEDEPTLIADPESSKPEDWDDEEDGDWTAPQVPNPKCQKVSGCGVWKQPTKKNPAYKGKWRGPMIDNPAYKGVWAPRKIANPDFFEDLTPANFNPIGAIGFELWTMQDKILFDNIYVGHSAEEAKKIAAETWAIKHAAEEKVEKAAQEEQKRDVPAADVDKFAIPKSFDEVVARVTAFVEKFQTSANKVKVIEEDPITFAGLVAVLLVPLLGALLILLTPASKPSAKVAPKKDAKGKSKKEEVEKEEDDEAADDDEPEESSAKGDARKRPAAKASKDEDDE